MDFVGAEKFSSGFSSGGLVMQEVTQPDPWLNSRFEPDFLVPVQFYDLTRRKGSLDGETRLVFAVLEDAIRCYVKNVQSTRRSDREQFEEVSAWFEAREGSRHPFSFEAVCDVLSIEPSTLRRQLKLIGPRDLPTKQLRSVGRRQVVRAGRSARKRARRAAAFQGVGQVRVG